MKAAGDLDEAARPLQRPRAPGFGGPGGWRVDQIMKNSGAELHLAVVIAEGLFEGVIP